MLITELYILQRKVYCLFTLYTFSSPHRLQMYVKIANMQNFYPKKLSIHQKKQKCE